MVISGPVSEGLIQGCRVGELVLEPPVISTLDQREEPWIGDGEIPSEDLSGLQ